MEAEARKSSRYHNENSNFIANEQKQQLMIRQQQDAILDNMSKGITTLQEMARGIESELEMQSKMIDDVDNRVDEVQVWYSFGIGIVCFSSVFPFESLGGCLVLPVDFCNFCMAPFLPVHIASRLTG